MMTDKFDMVAKTFLGLEGVLADELRTLGAEDVTEGNRVVAFKGDKETLYRANFSNHSSSYNQAAPMNCMNSSKRSIGSN